MSKVIFTEDQKTLPEERCGGCRICEVMCAFAHEGVFNPRRARIKVIRKDDVLPYGVLLVPFICQQCYNPACKDACIDNAIVKDDKNSIYVVDSDKCTGCGRCIEACSYKAIRLDPITGKALKCDLCGGDPACVMYCPTKVLKVRLGNLEYYTPHISKKRGLFKEG